MKMWGLGLGLGSAALFISLMQSAASLTGQTVCRLSNSFNSPLFVSAAEPQKKKCVPVCGGVQLLGLENISVRVVCFLPLLDEEEDEEEALVVFPDALLGVAVPTTFVPPRTWRSR